MDIGTLVSACAGGTSDRKIASEPTDMMDHKERHPDDSPPQSFWLSGDAELDWFNLNAFMERKESTKGNSNSSTNWNPSSNSNTAFGSPRHLPNFNSSTAILGLMKPHQNPRPVEAKHCKPGTTRFFPKRSRSGAKSETGSMIEPASPDVSCIGRVRSNKARRLRHRQKKEAKETSDKTERRKTSFLKSFLAIFRCPCGKESALESNRPIPVDSPSRKSEARRTTLDSTASEVEPPGLGDMKRFVSGRRSESWLGVAAERV